MGAKLENRKYETSSKWVLDECLDAVTSTNNHPAVI